ncbi:MAG: T9SS C-terminal target domain-containing protein, partial [Methanobacteriota archaeon]
DGGNSWEFQSTGINSDIVKINFLDENYGWALSWSYDNPFGTIILRTSDGGVNWVSEAFPEPSKFMVAIQFLDTLNGWLGGFPGEFYRTTDGGGSWTRANIDSGGGGSFPVLNFDFYSQLYGFACGGHIDLAGVIWRTLNGGDSWQPTVIGPEPIQDIHFFDSLNLIAVGGDFDFGTAVALSNNGGTTWNYNLLGVFGIAFKVSFRTESEGWCPLGYAQKFIYTTDAGVNWTEEPTPNGELLFDLVFTDSTHGYGVGVGGAILKYERLVGIPTEEPSFRNVPRQVLLLQNYPNPFNPVTTISYWLPEDAGVELSVFNSLGEKITTLKKGREIAGKHIVRFDGTKLPSGLYFYQLRVTFPSTHSETELTRKMLLVK